jgi:hypothetical protein
LRWLWWLWHQGWLGLDITSRFDAQDLLGFGFDWTLGIAGWCFGWIGFQPSRIFPFFRWGLMRGLAVAIGKFLFGCGGNLLCFCL